LPRRSDPAGNARHARHARRRNGSSAQSLRWFRRPQQRALPIASAITVPLWVLQARECSPGRFWLANALVGWLRYGFAAWARDGHWRAMPRKAKVDIPAATAPPAGNR